MVKENKRKKHHDKDKYYHLAKEQGYRSRAAFKLVQINRKHSLLESCKTAVLDLCAAPGGWTQVASRTCPSSCQIVAVDILPIRRTGDRRVTTLVGDITTDKCRADIQRALQGKPHVDLVLHDGAPNIGAEYGKDAFVQNELALAALRTAIQHLKPAGTFITKVYRSRDYHALHWAISQLFETVSVHKPAASRQQSAEIFLIGLQYKAPKSVDPKLTDPKHVFAMIEEDGGEDAKASLSTTVSVFSSHQPKRHRQGYDTHHYSFTTLRHVEPVRTFVQVDSVKQAIQMLSTSTEFAFTCPECNDDAVCPTCAFCKNKASADIQEQCSDLKLLSKADFKRLLLWRNKLHDIMLEDKKFNDTPESDDDDTASKASVTPDSDDDDDDEEAIQAELASAQQRRARESKRKTKKERQAAATRRRQAALGMDLNAIDISDYDNVFSLASLGRHELSTDVNLDRMTDEQIFGKSDDEEDNDGGEENKDEDEEAAHRRRRERDLDEAYEQYLQTTKDSVEGTKTAKRSKKLERQKLVDEAHEDQEMAMNDNLAGAVKTYAKLLHGNESDDDENEDDAGSDADDGFADVPMTPAEHRAVREKERNPLMHQYNDEKASSKTKRWFSNPLFASIEQAAIVPDTTGENQAEEKKPRSRSVKDDTAEEKKAGSMTVEDVIAAMPKTDKQKRHEKRLKQMEKDELKKSRKAAKLGKSESEFQLVAATHFEEADEEDKLHLMTDAEKKKELQARDLIKAGLGVASEPDNSNKKIDVVAALPVHDTRQYDSDNEDYDSDDHAKTLAIGTMILRRSKEKRFVDASYNRYAWNDPSDLPEWFVDDEARNYRPQLPIPPALMAKMKEKMMALSTKPIAKVAEARARKSRRAKLKLTAAKKKAESVANSNEMTESMKLKAISQALRGQESKRPGKTYVVAKKGRANNGVKGAKLVDKRMKNDKRSMDRSVKKRKHGKKGGLVGSKKRRKHK